MAHVDVLAIYFYPCICVFACAQWRSLKSPDVDRVMFEWFTEQKNVNMLVSGPLLLRKSENIAEKFGSTDF